MIKGTYANAVGTKGRTTLEVGSITIWTTITQDVFLNQPLCSFNPSLSVQPLSAWEHTVKINLL